MRRSIMRHVLVAAASLAGAAMTFPAMGQVPVPVGPDCVCLRIAVDALGADLATSPVNEFEFGIRAHSGASRPYARAGRPPGHTRTERFVYFSGRSVSR